MHKLIAKYVNAYQTEQGSSTEKVKKVLMRHSSNWEWAGSDSLVADLIDDSNITAQDIVDFLADTYEFEGGNEEFHYAVRALQICLRKAELAETAHQIADEEDFDGEEFDAYESDLYVSKANDILQTMQY